MEANQMGLGMPLLASEGWLGAEIDGRGESFFTIQIRTPGVHTLGRQTFVFGL